MTPASSRDGWRMSYSDAVAVSHGDGHSARICLGMVGKMQGDKEPEEALSPVLAKI